MGNPKEVVENTEKLSNVPAPEAPKAAWWWLKNTKNKPDAALTMLVVAFLIVTGTYALSVVGELTIGTVHLVMNAFTTDYATTVMAPLMALYFGRRYTDAKHEK